MTIRPGQIYDPAVRDNDSWRSEPTAKHPVRVVEGPHRDRWRTVDVVTVERLDGKYRRNVLASQFHQSDTTHTGARRQYGYILRPEATA
ncbi:hypothetical protein DT076_16750 [Desertihabitans brevis]|uniref:Uncharacterized protein n=1 Tax=Desertihabitans brevis TaxID=2268447 RepID=A0A367YQX7_9ACTN|nr:hypothetical protein [Desertihabitans brevis]RCK68296.1 hypothetical protein DT076_16750 [Desertihabitans brevis]